MSAARVLITGTTGYIGGRLSGYLDGLGFEVHTLNRRSPGDVRLNRFSHIAKFTDENQMAGVLDSVEPEFLIHLASRARPGRDLYEFESQIEDTLLPAISLSRTVSSKIKLAVFVGSCEEYGNGPTPFDEAQQLVSMSPYGWAKIATYDAVHLTLRQRGVPFCWARPFLTFGPGQRTEQLIPSLIDSCISNTTIKLSPGEQTRDFIFIEDLCEMFHTLIRRSDLAAGETFNLCSGIPRTVRSVAEQIQQTVGRGRLEFGALPYRMNEAMSFYGSNKKYVQLFGAPRMTNFNDALNRTIESRIDHS